MELIPLRDMQLSSLLQRLAARITGAWGQAEGKAPRAAGSQLKASPASFASYISDAAARYGVPTDLVQAVIQTESNFNPHAVSSAGAKGLMQLMDGTARTMGVQDVFDPQQNIEGGVRYLSAMLKKYDNNLPLAVAAYNAGPGAVDRYAGVPPYAETQAYVRRVMSLFDRSWEA